MITQLYRYPVKGLSPEALHHMDLLAGEGLAGDRVFAIARTPSSFDAAKAQAQPKHKFLMLMRDEALAALETRYEDASGVLTIYKDGALAIAATLDRADDCAALEAFFRAYLEDPKLEPKVVRAPGHKFTDISVVSPEKMRALSLINEQSVQDLERACGQSVEPLRFRANIYFKDVPAWQELDWVGREIMIGGTRAKVVMRTKRCAATQVNPATAARDINVPVLINTHFGHFDMGVYAEVCSDAQVSIGDPITLL